MTEGYLIGYELAQIAVQRLAGGDRDKVWGSMTYGCNGRKKGDGFDLPPCGHEERYYLGVGVEGPQRLRQLVNGIVGEIRGDGFPDENFWTDLKAKLGSLGSTIPAPFGAGSCPQCYGGEMLHVRFSEDEDFGEELRDPPEGARYFRVPDMPSARLAARFKNYGGAELVAA